ncbi:hypothetical protein [Streptomyces sindenensis]|uniref:Uncharacterized protein n=1 Tax=Streptomyces sindenensis TaxID=67363 RepID=A0ABW6E816_9ACTN
MTKLADDLDQMQRYLDRQVQRMDAVVDAIEARRRGPAAKAYRKKHRAAAKEAVRIRELGGRGVQQPRAPSGQRAQQTPRSSGRGIQQRPHVPGGFGTRGVLRRPRADRESNHKYPLDLANQEGTVGAHVVDKHVGKTDEQLEQRLRDQQIVRPSGIRPEAVSTFTTLADAQR